MNESHETRTARNTEFPCFIRSEGTWAKIIQSDNLPVSRKMPDRSVTLIYVDPPFNTDKRQERLRVRTVHDEAGGARTDFQRERYRTVQGEPSLADFLLKYYNSMMCK